MIASFVDCEFVSMSPGSISEGLSGFIDRAKAASEWLEDELGLEMKGRIPAYSKALEQYRMVRGTFGDKLYAAIQSLNEMSDVIDVSERLRDQASPQFLGTVKSAIYGPEFRGQLADAGKEVFRNYLFELAVAASYKRHGYAVDLSTKTDILLKDPAVAIECKRVTSRNKIRSRIGEAAKQIVGNNGSDRACVGPVYIDITSLFEEASTVYVFNETEVPYSMTRPSSDEDVVSGIGIQILQNMRPLIESIAGECSDLLSDAIPCIVVNYDCIGFHVSLIHERAAVCKVGCLISNDRYFDGEIVNLVKSTMGVEIPWN